jgi:hypothetical protein
MQLSLLEMEFIRLLYFIQFQTSIHPLNKMAKVFQINLRIV